MTCRWCLRLIVDPDERGYCSPCAHDSVLTVLREKLARDKIIGGVEVSDEWRRLVREFLHEYEVGYR